MTLIAGETARGHRDLFAEYQQSYPPKIRDPILTGQQVTDQQLQDACLRRGQIAEEITKQVSKFDLTIAPADPGSAPKGISSTGDHRMNLLATHTGMPALTLPCALDSEGLPLGVQLIGQTNKDQLLPAAGSVIENIISFTEQPQSLDDD